MDPAGRPLVLPDGSSLTVIGIARDIRSQSAGAVDGPHLYRLSDTGSEAIVVRFSGDPGSFEPAVRATMREVDPQSFAAPRTLRAIMDEIAGRFGTIVRTVLVLACVALSLAVLGIYGVVAFAVSRQTKEFGIRMALGATKRLIVQSVLGSNARPALYGLASGLGMSMLTAQAMTKILARTPVGLNASDPMAYAAVSLLLAAVAIGAMVVPALRAARADPAAALRDE